MKSVKHTILVELFSEILRCLGCQLVLREHLGADIIAVHASGGFCNILAGEVELSPRNCVRNIQRDVLHLHSNNVVIVCPDEIIRLQIIAKLQRYLDSKLLFRTIIFLPHQISTPFFRAWFCSAMCKSQTPHISLSNNNQQGVR